MAVTINTYTGLQTAFLEWRARSGATYLSDRFDDFLLNAEQRIYYGHAVENPLDPLHSPPLRIPEMEVEETDFDPTGAASDATTRITEGTDIRVTEDALDQSTATSGTVQLPANFLELISAYNNSTNGPIKLVAQRILDAYGTQSLGSTALVAISGQNFRFKDVPTSGTITLRYFQKLASNTATETNDILDRYPNVYLYGLLIESAIYEQDDAAAAKYLSLYNSTVNGLNARRQRMTASANPVIRVRAGMAP